MLEFFREAAGAIAIGLVVGFVIGAGRKHVGDVNTELPISLFSAYGAFIPADQLGVWGVLAAACGVYLGFRAPEIASPESRLRMMHEIYGAQREAPVALRNDRQISSDVMRRVSASSIWRNHGWRSDPIPRRRDASRCHHPRQLCDEADVGVRQAPVRG